jgi:hypothetical protein
MSGLDGAGTQICEYCEFIQQVGPSKCLEGTWPGPGGQAVAVFTQFAK